MIFDGSRANLVNSAATFMDGWRLVPEDILGYHIVGSGYLEDSLE